MMLPQPATVPVRSRAERAAAGPTLEQRRQGHIDLLRRAMTILDASTSAVAADDRPLDDTTWPGEVYNVAGGPMGEHAALFTPGVAECLAGLLSDANAALVRSESWNAGHLEFSPMYVELVEAEVARHHRTINMARRIVAAHERREAS